MSENGKATQFFCDEQGERIFDKSMDDCWRGNYGSIETLHKRRPIEENKCFRRTHTKNGIKTINKIDVRGETIYVCQIIIIDKQKKLKWAVGGDE